MVLVDPIPPEWAKVSCKVSCKLGEASCLDRHRHQKESQHRVGGMHRERVEDRGSSRNRIVDLEWQGELRHNHMLRTGGTSLQADHLHHLHLWGQADELEEQMRRLDRMDGVGLPNVA